MRTLLRIHALLSEEATSWLASESVSIFFRLSSLRFLFFCLPPLQCKSCPAHGCNGTATKQVIVQIPEGVTAVKPQMIPNWRVTTGMRPLAGSAASAGSQ